MALSTALVVGCGGALPRSLALPRYKRCLVTASSSKTNTDELRSQLDMLHAEAEATRGKVNSARLRLLRLTEAAEKLKRQAAINVQSGRENDARELLYQRKKVMHAMERSRSRIQLLDQLCAKLNETISMKESQLIANISTEYEVEKEDDDSLPVHIVPLKHEIECNTVDNTVTDPDTLKLTDSENSGSFASDERSPPLDKSQEVLGAGTVEEESIIRVLKGISSYEDFLEHLDTQLDKIEAELVTILNVSSLVLNDAGKHKSSRVQEIVELLESVTAIRQRIRKKIEIR